MVGGEISVVIGRLESGGAGGCLRLPMINTLFLVLGKKRAFRAVRQRMKKKKECRICVP